MPPASPAYPSAPHQTHTSNRLLSWSRPMLLTSRFFAPPEVPVAPLRLTRGSSASAKIKIEGERDALAAVLVCGPGPRSVRGRIPSSQIWLRPLFNSNRTSKTYHRPLQGSTSFGFCPIRIGSPDSFAPSPSPLPDTIIRPQRGPGLLPRARESHQTPCRLARLSGADDPPCRPEGQARVRGDSAERRT